jgi:hypothetical protein
MLAFLTNGRFGNHTAVLRNDLLYALAEIEIVWNSTDLSTRSPV